MSTDAPTLPPTVAPSSTDQDDGPRARSVGLQSGSDGPQPRSDRPPALPDLGDLERLLGDLVVEGEIARTARAAVYRVRMGGEDGDRPLALKVALQPSGADDLARFRHEASLLSEVRHPNVVEVREVGVLEGRFPFLVMELVQPYPHRCASPPRIPEAGKRPERPAKGAAGTPAAAGDAAVLGRGLRHRLPGGRRPGPHPPAGRRPPGRQAGQPGVCARRRRRPRPGRRPSRERGSSRSSTLASPRTSGIRSTGGSGARSPTWRPRSCCRMPGITAPTSTASA